MPRNFTPKALLRPTVLAALFATAVLSLATGAEAARVHVHGAARIEAHLARESGQVMVRGRTLDDAGEALPHAVVKMRIERKADAHAVAAATLAATECDGVARALEATDDTVTMRADDAGRFCAKMQLPVDHYVTHLSVDGTSLLDAATFDLPTDLTARPLTLVFDPVPKELSLDDGPIVIEARASVDDDDADSPASNVDALLLTLATESGSPLASATTDQGGHARFTVDPTKLGPPGEGELRASYRGDAERTKADVSAKVLRRARVHIIEREPIAGGAPDDGIAIPLFVATANGEPVPNGSVEARLDGTVVGAAPVAHGKADLKAIFAAPASSSVSLRLDYMPTAPWYDGSEATTVEVPVHPPSAWKQVPLYVMAVGVALFLLLERSRRTPRPLPRPAVPTLPKAEPDVHVVRTAKETGAGWTGRVIDAHERTPIERARVAIEHVTFGSPEILESAVTDADGRFTIGRQEHKEQLGLSSLGWNHRGRTLVDLDARLVIDAPLHATLKKRLPPSGEVEIALVSRKRAILDRLVEWARLRGKPYDARPEPTPAHVVHAAQGKEGTIGEWAAAIEHAAYAAGDVDARVEQEIDAIAPKNDPLARPRP